MPVDRSFQIEVTARFQMQRDTGKSFAGKKTGETLADRSARTVRVDVKHLPSAIDDHSKLAHLATAEQAVDMSEWDGEEAGIRAGHIHKSNRHVCQHTTAKRDGPDFALAIMLRASSKRAANVCPCFFDAQSECPDAVGIDKCNRRSGVDHQRSVFVINGAGDEEMVAEPSLQFRANKSMTCQETSERTAALLRPC